MNAFTPMVSFEPAYRQLNPAERSFVDDFVASLERIAAHHNAKLTTVLQTNGVPANADGRTLAMLERALVRAAIVDRVREIAEDAELSVYKTLKELRAVAYSNIKNYMETDSYGLPMFDLSRATPEQLSAVKSIKYTQNPKGGHSFEFTLHDKMSALDKVMRYQGLLDPDNEHWRSEVSSPVEALDANVSDNEAADVYARAIGAA